MIKIIHEDTGNTTLFCIWLDGKPVREEEDAYGNLVMLKEVNLYFIQGYLAGSVGVDFGIEQINKYLYNINTEALELVSKVTSRLKEA